MMVVVAGVEDEAAGQVLAQRGGGYPLVKTKIKYSTTYIKYSNIAKFY